MSKLLSFQRFNLEDIAELNEEEISKLNPKAGESLIRELLKRGYSILVSNEKLCGINKSIIIGGEYYQGFKDDFYEIAKSLGLKYKSREDYTQREYS